VQARPSGKFATIASDRPARRSDLIDNTIPLIARAAASPYGQKRPDAERDPGDHH
jgi:hypothetical protein